MKKAQLRQKFATIIAQTGIEVRIAQNGTLGSLAFLKYDH